MCPFSIVVPDVPDGDLGQLVTMLAQAGFENPIVEVVGANGASGPAARPARGVTADFPADWHVVRERAGQSYRWPKRRDRYAPYRVFMGTTLAEGPVHIALGETFRANAWGRERKYVVAFLSSGSPQQPLVEFVATDDYEQTRELVAVIRGSDGGRRMYGAADVLPAVYAERFTTEIYNDRIVYPGAWNRVAVVTHEDDAEAMLNHALIQSRRRDRR
jgi:hypothetical protein